MTGLPTRAVRLLGMLATLMVVGAGAATACAICLSAVSVTTGQRLDAAGQAVLAVPLPDGEQFRIVEVVKGNAATTGVLTEKIQRLDAVALHGGKPLLLLRDALGRRWTSVGTIGVEHAAWLRQLVASGNGSDRRPRLSWPPTLRTATGSELTDEQWRERLALVVPYLEHPEQLAADIAYGELARAPYRVLRRLSPRLAATTVAGWINDPKLTSRRAAYLLLLGVVGGPTEAAQLEQLIDAAWQSHAATDLAAMLAANLELRGPPRMGSVETRYLTDSDRTMPEIEAALLALSVHGEANGVVPRDRVIRAYRLFMQAHKPMAGFVAKQLADWAYWDASSEYGELIRSHTIADPSSEMAIVNYLQRSPRADAKMALQSLSDVRR